MIAEATSAGYIARTQSQLHNDDGTWGKHEYFVGMPDDVLRAIQKAGVAIAPRPYDPHTDLPHAQNDFTNHKVKSPQKTNIKKESHPSSLPLVLDQALKRHASGRPKGQAIGKEVIQQRLAARLGNGNVELGWLIMGGLSAARLDEMTALERLGRLTDLDVLNAASSVAIAQSKEPAR
jgi:hypothetical protein